MQLREKLPGMTTESGIIHLLQNIAFGTVYFFVGMFALAIIIGIVAPIEPTETTAADAQTETKADSGAEKQEKAAEKQEKQEKKSQAQNSQDENEKAAQEPEAEPKPEPEKQEAKTQESAKPVDSEKAPQASPAVKQEQAEQEEIIANDQLLGDAEEALAGEGMDVLLTDAGNGEIQAQYFSTAAGDSEQLATELGKIMGAYAVVVDEGYPTDSMTIEVMTSTGAPVGEYTASADDAQAYMDGEITAEEYTSRTLATQVIY